MTRRSAIAILVAAARLLVLPGLQSGKLESYAGAHVWTQEFGSRSC